VRSLAPVLLFLVALPVHAEEATSPDRKAASAVSPETALQGGIDWIVANQNDDGSWGNHKSGRRRAIWCDVPGGHHAFRAATSALCVAALRGLEPKRRTKATEAAAAKGLAHLVRVGAVKRSQPAQMYNVWALGYSLRALSEAILDPREGEDPEPWRETARELILSLGVYQCVDGGWGYFDFKHRTFNPSGDGASFTTATCVIALHRAKQAGLSVPQRMMRRATSALKRYRNPDGSWIYSGPHRDWRRGVINRPKGSLSRTPACAWALHTLTGKPDAAEFEKGLRWLVKHHRFAWAAVREPTPHRSWYSVSGYFYLYGYAYASYALDYVPAENRAQYRAPLMKAVVMTRAPDGSFWDYPLYGYHKPYGTAYAVIALDRLLRVPATK